MAQTSGLWTTSGAPAGHQVASYTQVHASKMLSIVSACSGFEGVAPNYLNELAPSTTGANNCRIATGGAMADGKWFDNSANVDVVIPSAVGGGNTRIDRVVLRVSWAAFTAIITRIAGTDAASPVAPAITQTSGTTYDITLCQCLVDVAGEVTITDERTWAGSMVYRQGGHATDFSVYGATTYGSVNPLMQVGSKRWNAAASPSGSISVTFPRAFSDKPIVFLSVYEDNQLFVSVIPTATGFTGFWVAKTGDETDLTFYWLAIGPK